MDNKQNHHRDQKSWDEQSANAVQLAGSMAKQYIMSVDDRAIVANKSAMQSLTQFETPFPQSGASVEETLGLLNRYGSPATTATTGGRFFGLVVGGTLPHALGARVLNTSWDQVVFNDATSPIGIKLEQVASSWLLDILGLPKKSSVGFTTGATMGNLACMAAARQALLKRNNWDLKAKGLCKAPPIRVVASEQIHVTILKGLGILGIGIDNIEFVKCDNQGRIILDELPPLDSNTLVLTQAGNLNSGSFDPIGQICERANGAWVHVDGAFGLWAAASSSTRHLLAGIENADSWVCDGHKWLNTAYDCGIMVCKSPKDLFEVMTTHAPFLGEGAVAAPKDMVPEFSRSARAVEVWAALHGLGKDGLENLIDRTCNHARQFAKGLELQGFEILNDVVINQVVATIKGHENQMPELAERVQSSGIAWFGSTVWQSRTAIRLSVSSWVTTKDDIEITLKAIDTERRKVLRS